MEEKQVGTDPGANDDNREKTELPMSLPGEQESKPAAMPAKTNRLALTSVGMSLAALLILCGVVAAMMSPHVDNFMCGGGPVSGIVIVSVCFVVPVVLILVIATGSLAHDQIGRRAGTERGLWLARIGIGSSVVLVPCLLCSFFLVWVTEFAC